MHLPATRAQAVADGWVRQFVLAVMFAQLLNMSLAGGCFVVQIIPIRDALDQHSEAAVAGLRAQHLIGSRLTTSPSW